MPFYAQLTIPFFMVVSGITFSISYSKNRMWYLPQTIWRRITRLWLPYLPVYLICLALIGLPSHWAGWLGADGWQLPGSYYLLIMIQLIAIFPVIRIFSSRVGWGAGMVSMFVFQVLYELLTYLVDLSPAIYRLLVFRYLIFVYLGTVIYDRILVREVRADEWKRWLCMMPLGLIYIITTVYLGWRPQVVFRYDTWFRSAAPTAFYVAPLVAIAVLYRDRIVGFLQRWTVTRVCQKVLNLCGKASWHIFIVQMLWFGFAIPVLEPHGWEHVMLFPLSLLVCLGCGIGYYYLNLKFVKGGVK